MRVPSCPHCGLVITKHLAGRCLDYWFAEAVLGWVWVKKGEGYRAYHGERRLLTPPDVFERANVEGEPPVFVPADGTEPMLNGPGVDAPDDNVPFYSTSDEHVTRIARHMGELGFNLAMVRYADEARWKCSFIHAREGRAIGGLTDASLPYAIVSAAIEAVDLLGRYTDAAERNPANP